MKRRKKMKKLNLILVLFLVVMVSGIGIVSAETLTGTIGGANYTQTTITQSGATSSGATLINGLYVNTFQNTGNLKSIILYSKGAGTAFVTDAGAPSGSSTPVTIRISNESLNASHLHTLTNGRIVGTGTFGYQKVFNTATPPVENPAAGYLWLAIDSWDLGTETGVQYLSFDYDPSEVFNVSYGFYGGSGVAIPAGFASFSIARVENDAEDASGTSISNLKDNAISATYTVSKPAGIGIAGNISKLSGGQTFVSQAIVYGANGAILTSESTLTPNTFNFSTSAEQVILGIKDSSGNLYNTSLLFSPVGVTPTPTPTVTQDPNMPIPDGYVRSMFQAVDGVTSGHIHGANLSIKDETTGTWSNITDRFDGTWFIDTLPGHVVSGYGDATGYTATSLLNKPASGTVMYELIMQPGSVPPAPAGKVKLFVLVNDYDTGKAIDQAIVTVYMFQDSTIMSNTNNAGSVQMSVKNNTAFSATAEKNGYTPQTRTGTTTASGPDTIRIELRRATVTPVVTGTIIQGELTVRPTIDTRTANEKDQDMMDQIREAGPFLISLCILSTVIFLVGGMGKK